MQVDYIVIGAGSAGAVVAGRLAEESGVSVLLLEAGDKGKHLNIQVPAAFSKQFMTKHDWNYRTEPEPHLDGRTIYHPRGKMLGGSSGQNAMIYIRGNRADFDGWADAGAKGWAYDEVMPYFKRSEHNSRGASAYHGADGPMYIEDPRDPNPFSQTLVDAMVSVGMQRNGDFNGAAQEGVGSYQVSQHRGRRWTTADGFLRQKRSNMQIWTGATVHRVLIENGRAVGAEIDRDGIRTKVWAGSEVVLSAGAFGTPHLLMLSGIGPADHLREHGIAVVADSPHVGSHLMDHPMYLLNFETSAPGTLIDAEKPIQLAKYLARRKGMLTSNIGEVGGFFHTGAVDSAAPDMQLIGAPGFFWNHGFESHASPAYALGCSLVGSASEGTVRLKNAASTAQPTIRFNYFEERSDMEAMVSAIERVREIVATPALRGVTGQELYPGKAASSRAEIEAEIRRSAEHTYHPACTARIGSESDGVVSPTLEVYGVAGLRVADASVFPRIPHGNTHAATMMVGEKAADLIRSAR